MDEAVRFFTAAVALHPENPGARINLGVVLSRKRNLDGAIEAFRAAVRLSPGYTYAYNNLGATLRRKGDLDGAIRAYQEGIRLRPEVGVTHLNLASALEQKGDLDGAATEYREFIRLQPTEEGYQALGGLLARTGQFAQAREILRLGQEKLSGNRSAVEALARTLQECEHLAELDSKFPKILRGETQPANNAERLELARWCAEHKKLHLAAVLLFRDAFAQEPAAAENPRTQDRYNAACAAALAGCGQGKDADQSDAKERGRLRRQALDWLRADLTAYRRLLEKEPDKARPAVRERMRHWQQDKDFAGVRGEALDKLPEVERREWQRLWQEVEALRQQAADPASKPKPPNPPK